MNSGHLSPIDGSGTDPFSSPINDAYLMTNAYQSSNVTSTPSSAQGRSKPLPIQQQPGQYPPMYYPSPTYGTMGDGSQYAGQAQSLASMTGGTSWQQGGYPAPSHGSGGNGSYGSTSSYHTAPQGSEQGSYRSHHNTKDGEKKHHSSHHSSSNSSQYRR